MAGRHSSTGFIEGLRWRIGARDDSGGNHTDSPHQFRGREIMKSATRRTIIAAGALTAAGLFGSLPYHGSTQALGVPTQHHDVALVDAFTTLLGDEGTLDNAFWGDVLGPNGAEATLYNDLVTAFGATEATKLLDATGANPIFSGAFNGAESRGFEALFLNGLVGEDQLNQALGVTATASQTELLSVFNADFVPIPASAGVTLSDLTSALGTSAFDTDLTSIANADYALAASDFEGYLTSLAGDTSALGEIGTLLTDLSNSFSDLGTNLTTDFSQVITDITALLGGGLL
jgi:hypothetical protein